MEIKIKDSNTTMCPNCGKELEPNCKFCKNCGTKIDIAEDKNVEETIGIITEETSEQSKINEHMHKSLKGKKKFAFILFGILALIIVLFLIFSNNSKNNKLLNNNEIVIRTSPNKYTWYIKNYVGKNCASFGYTSLGGDKRDRYGDATVLLVLIADDGSFIDPEDEEMLKQYTVTGQNISPNTELKLVFQKDSSGKEVNLLESQNIEEIELKVKKIPGAKSKKVTESSLDAISEDSNSTDKSSKTDTTAEDMSTEISVIKAGLLEDNFEYSILSNDTVEITGYTGSKSSVSIPSEIDDMDVSRIGISAFENCTTLSDITIWADIEIFGDYCFKGCTRLKDISISSEATYIGKSAFEDCTSLEDVIIWGDIEIFGDSAFKNCTSLKDISIPSSTITIGTSAFEGCTSLEEVTFWGVEEIGNNAFRDCTELDEVSIPSDTKSIGAYAFYGCSKLKDVTIWDDNTTIGKEAFGNCPKATIDVI